MKRDCAYTAIGLIIFMIWVDIIKPLNILQIKNGKYLKLRVYTNNIVTMTNQEMISQLNASLVKEQPDITIIDYVNLLNEKIFNIDISFIDDFIDLVDKDNCCIDHELLMKYGITTLSSGSNDVKKIIERNDGQETVDYELSQLA